MQGGIYQHYKGDFYQVLGIARMHDTGQRMVVYVSLDPYKPGPRMNVRSEEDFNKPVEGEDCHRFTYIGDEI